MPDSVTKNTPVRIRWNELPGMLLHVREPRVIGHFPEKSIKVREVAGVTAPVCCVRRLHDVGAKCRDVCQQRVHLGRGAHIVGQGKTGEPRALRRYPGVRRQVLARPKGKPGLAELEEGCFAA
jgi:hypothetical protein